MSTTGARSPAGNPPTASPTSGTYARTAPTPPKSRSPSPPANPTGRPSRSSTAAGNGSAPAAPSAANKTNTAGPAYSHTSKPPPANKKHQQHRRRTLSAAAQPSAPQRPRPPVAEYSRRRARLHRTPRPATTATVRFSRSPGDCGPSRTQRLPFAATCGPPSGTKPGYTRDGPETPRRHYGSDPIRRGPALIHRE